MTQHEPIEALAHEAWLRQRQGVITLENLTTGAIAPPEPLFSGLLLHKTITMVSAEPFSAKTLWMLAAAISLASGKPLFGRFAPTELRRTLFIGQDAPTWDYARQALKLARGYGLTPDDLKDADVDFMLNSGVRITDTSFIEWVNMWYQAVGFEVLMLDTLLSIHGSDENDNRQMAAIMHILKRIRDEFGCAVIFSHHTSKPSGDVGMSANYRARGATSIVASVDFHFQLQRDNNRVNMLMPKGRGADDMEPPPYFTIEQTKVDEGHKIVLSAPSEADREAALMALLRAPVQRATIINNLLTIEPELGVERMGKWADNQLQRLKREGRIEQVKKGVWQLSS